ncbi:MAG: hypothetical protein M3O29_06370 [Actinomycetota bacterium]|nr:hypothetical protein [Actinomycetota bacterium]
MRKATIIIATLFASLGAWQMIASAGTRTVSPTTATTTDITFTEGFCSDAGAHCKVVGDKSDPLAFGNRLIFTIPLSSGGTRIGYEQGDCVYLQKTSKSDYCTYNLHLPNGSVSVQGTLPYISENSQMSGRVPITGGTRGYLGAYGTIQLIAGTFDYPLHIVTP